jgi:hypothetical protein
MRAPGQGPADPGGETVDLGQEWRIQRVATNRQRAAIKQPKRPANQRRSREPPSMAGGAQIEATGRQI